MEKRKFELEKLLTSDVSSELKDRIIECHDKHEFLTFNEAKTFIKTLRLHSKEQYENWHKNNCICFLPFHPDIYYNDKTK